MFERLRSLIFGKKPTLPPLWGKPPGVEPDDPDTIAPAPAPENGLQSIGGLLLEILYTDTHGNTSARRVTCRRLIERRGRHYLEGICHERRAYRCFRLDRIDEIIDPETGEILDVEDLLADYTAERAEAFGLSDGQTLELVSFLTVLVFIARCDRDWHDAEKTIIHQFIEEWWVDRGFGSRAPEKMHLHMLRMAPGPDDVMAALSYMARINAPREAFLSTLTSVIEADGVFTAEEWHWMQEMRKHVEQLGR